MTDIAPHERVWVFCRRAEDPKLAVVPDEKIAAMVRRWPALASNPQWFLPAKRSGPLALA